MSAPKGHTQVTAPRRDRMAPPLAQLSELGSLFGGIAAVDPISTVLVALGAILMVGSLGFFGYLVAGAAVDLVIPDRIGRTRRPGA